MSLSARCWHALEHQEQDVDDPPAPPGPDDVLEYRKLLALPSGPMRNAVEWDACLDDALTEVERLRAENAKLRGALEEQNVFERVWENPDAFGGATEGTDGWECAICEAAHFATKEELTHEPTCALYRGVPSESEGKDG